MHPALLAPIFSEELFFEQSRPLPLPYASLPILHTVSSRIQNIAKSAKYLSTTSLYFQPAKFSVYRLEISILLTPTHFVTQTSYAAILATWLEPQNTEGLWHNKLLLLVIPERGQSIKRRARLLVGLRRWYTFINFQALHSCGTA